MPTDKEIAKLVISLEAQLKDFKGQLTDAKKVVKDFAGEADSSLKKADKSANVFVNTLKGFVSAQTILGLVRKGFNELKQLAVESVEAYKKQTDALASLRAALGYIPPELVKQATEIQKLTGIGDEQVNMVQAAIGVWIKETDQIKKVTEAAIDFGKAKQMDVVSAADLLTKSIISETNALGRYGIEVKGAVGSTERLESVVNGVNNAYKGWAEELAKTDVGRLEIVKAQIDDIKETIGKGVLPAQIEWNKLLLKAVEFIAKISTGIGLQALKIRGINEDQLEQYRHINEILPFITDEENKQKQIKFLQLDLLYKQLALQEKLEQTPKTIETTSGTGFSQRRIENPEIKKLTEQNKFYAELMQSLLQLTKKTMPEVTKIVTDETDKTLKIIETSLTVFSAELKAALQNIEIEYETGRITATEYYGTLRALATEAAEKEIGAINDKIKQLTNLNAINEENNKIRAIEIGLSAKIAEINQKEKKDRDDLTKKYDEETKAIKDQLDILDKEQALYGATDLEKQLAALQDAHDKKLDMLADAEQHGLDVTKRIEDEKNNYIKEQARITSEYEKEQRQKTLEILSTSFGQVTDVFEKFYDQRLQIINNTEQAIENAENAGDTAKAARLRRQLEAQKAAARRQFYIAKSLALAEAIINMALTITKINSQAGIYSLPEIIAMTATNAAAIGAIAGQMIAGPGFETGGSVDGQSGRDAIRARLTRGEFVEPVPAVQHYGEGVMEAIRRRSIPRSLLLPYSAGSPRRSSHAFAEGGLATPAGNEMSLQINNIVSPALMGDYLSSRAGQSLILNVISQNSYEVRRRMSI